MLGVEFLVRGAMKFNEPVSDGFRGNSPRDRNQRGSLGFDIQALARRKKLYLDFLSVEPSEIKEAATTISKAFHSFAGRNRSGGRKTRHVDTLEALFSSFSNPQICALNSAVCFAGSRIAV